MVSRFSACDPHRLRLLLEDRLPEETQRGLARHLESCRGCRVRLESLAAEAGWWSDVRELLSPAPNPRSPTVTMETDDPGSNGAAKPVRGHAGKRPRLEFLSASDDPQKLGRLGPYEISAVIGSGGMGVVLKGLDAALNRYVAIKVLAPQLATSAAARRRFAREARAAAAVTHEHVVAIHAVDSAEGLPYLVMPLIAGESLQQRIDRSGPLEVREILRIGMQTAAGLAAAHAQGLVHRDVKPANILLENGVERVMITDFGLARAIDDASMTQSGVVAGTPQYMAPEQARGETVDHRADLFSLGSVMYAMCTGRSPFRAATTMGVLRRIGEDVPRPIRQINPDVPEWLAEIIAKLHEKDPADRFPSAADVAELLGQHLAHLQHPSAVPMPERLKGTAASRQRARRRRNRVLIAALLLLAGGFVVTETTGVTRLAANLAVLFARRQAEPKQASVARLHVAKVPPESIESPLPDPSILMGPQAFQEAVESLRRGLDSLEADMIQQGTGEDPPEPLALAGARLDALDRQLREGAGHGLSQALPAMAAQLDQLEQEDYCRVHPDSPSIDELLSTAGRQLEALELELKDAWP